MFSTKSLLFTVATLGYLTSKHNVSATSPPIPPEYASGCVECLDDLYAWTVGECHRTCDVADAACYSQKYFVGQSSQEICALINEQQPKSKAPAIHDCTPCVRSGFAWRMPRNL